MVRGYRRGLQRKRDKDLRRQKIRKILDQHAILNVQSGR